MFGNNMRFKIWDGYDQPYKWSLDSYQFATFGAQ